MFRRVVDDAPSEATVSESIQYENVKPLKDIVIQNSKTFVALPSKNPLSLTSDDLEKNSIETTLLYLAEALNAKN